MIDEVRISAYHRQKQYSAIVGNFKNENFNTIGRFDFQNTTKVYQHLAKYTRVRTEDFFNLKGKQFDSAVEEFKKSYEDYAELSKSQPYQEIINSLTFGYQLDPKLSSRGVLRDLSTQLAKLNDNLIEMNDRVDGFVNSIKDAKYFRQTLIDSANEAKTKKQAAIKKNPSLKSKPFNFRNHIINSYFGHAVRTMGIAAETLTINSIKKLEGSLIKISNASIVGAKKTTRTSLSQGKEKSIEYTSKGDISFELQIGDNAAQVIFGSIKFKKGSSEEFYAVKGTSLSAIPGNEKFKTDFTNLLLSSNKSSDKDVKFLTSLIIDFALIGVYNRPMYFLTVTPTTAKVEFFYEIYEAYASASSGMRPYIQRSSFDSYVYLKGESFYTQPGTEGLEQGQNFYKNVKYSQRLDTFSKGKGYMQEEYAIKRTDITDLVVIGKLTK